MHPTDGELEEIRAGLEELTRGRKVVVMGVGNQVRGDDGFGITLAERIEGRVACPLFITWDLPEDYAVKAADLRPDLVLILDAADFGAEAGQLRLIRAQEIPPTPGVTHRPSLEMMACFFEMDAGAETWVLGAQPEMTHIYIRDDMSKPMMRAIERLEPILVDLLGEAECPR